MISTQNHDNTKKRASHDAGFTLLEMVVVVAIFTLIVGLVIELPEMFLLPKMVESTRDEMTKIETAVLSYYRDVEAFPASLVDLVDPNTPPSGWLGPYLQTSFADSEATQDSYRHDEWLSDYLFTTVSTSIRRLTSVGPNRINNSGGGDDIVLDIDASKVMRDITRREMSIVNNIISTYNADFLFSNTLSTTYSNLLDQLQSAGYLPNTTAAKSRYLTDAWGQQYTTGGASPVIEISSVGSPSS